MSYFILNIGLNSTDEKEIFPQVQKMSPKYDYDKANSVHALSKAVYNLPDFIPDLNYFIVHNRAELTDFLSVSVAHGGFLISSRVKLLIEQFNLPIHKFYSARVYHKNNFYDYYWLHIISNVADYVDYPKSKFFIYQNYAHNLGFVEVNSKEDFIFKREKIEKDNPGKTVTIWSEKIVLTDQFNKNSDLFKVGTFDANYYISQKLKTASTDNKITGLNLSLASQIFL